MLLIHPRKEIVLKSPDKIMKAIQRPTKDQKIYLKKIRKRNAGKNKNKGKSKKTRMIYLTMNC